MAIEAIVNALYGRDGALSTIHRYAFIPGGSIVAIKRMLDKEEAQYGHNGPRSTLALTSAAVVELVKTGGYAAVLTMAYYMLK